MERISNVQPRANASSMVLPQLSRSPGATPTLDVESWEKDRAAARIATMVVQDRKTMRTR